jgi:hypothetical protein
MIDHPGYLKPRESAILLKHISHIPIKLYMKSTIELPGIKETMPEAVRLGVNHMLHGVVFCLVSVLRAGLLGQTE